MRASLLAFVAGCVLAACGAKPSGTVDAGHNSTPFDAGSPHDAGPEDAGPQDAGPPVPCAPTTGKWVSGYYVDYEQPLYPTAEIDWCGLTHIMVSHVMPNTDGSLNTSPDGVSVLALAATLVPEAHMNGRKAIMHIGGANSEPGFNGATSAGNMATFKSNLESLLSSTGADGLDFDWEPLDSLSGNANASEDEAALLSLTQAIRSDLPSVILSVSVYWVSGNYKLSGGMIDAFYSQVAPTVDQINIQTYQMEYAGQKTSASGWDSWYTSALYYPNPGAGHYSSTPGSVDSSVQAYIGSGVPPAKLGIGIPFFGECWQNGITGPNQTLTAADDLNPNDDGVMTYAKIATDFNPSGAAMYDTNAQQPYLTYATPPTPRNGLPSTCTFISYDDPQSIAAKGAYVKANSLGGTIVWTINQGYIGSGAEPDPLMTALYQGFLQ